MKRLITIIAILISASVFGQTTPTLPPGSIQVQTYKNTNGKNYVGNAAKKFEVIALQRSLDSIQAVLIAEILANTTPDATTSVKGKIKLAGDLGGTADLPTVPGLTNKANLTGGNTFTGQQETNGSGGGFLSRNNTGGTFDARINFGQGFVSNYQPTGQNNKTAILYAPAGLLLTTNNNSARADLKSDLLTTGQIYQFGPVGGTLAITSDIPNPSLYQLRSEKATANGYASLDGSGRVPLDQLPTGTQTYVGTWNAATNTPTLANGVGTLGQYVIVNVPGTQNLGAGSDTYALGDNVIYSGSVWEKVPNSGGVTSVNGMTGAVSLTTTNTPEGTNLYYTNARVSANTDVSANTSARHSAVTIGTANGLSLSGQEVSMGLSGASSNGALSSADWNTFNNKQPAGSYEPAFTKNTAFNKNFGTSTGTVAEGSDSRINNGQTAFSWGNHAGLYPTYNGTGATGNWAINAATASTTPLWSGMPFSPVELTTSIYVMGLDASTNTWKYQTLPGLASSLNINTGGETLQSVTARGNKSDYVMRISGQNSFVNGNGLEFFYDGSKSVFQSYGRGTTDSYQPLYIGASYHNMDIGNVGIGYTTDQGSKLSVNGSGYFASDMTVQGTMAATAATVVNAPTTNNGVVRKIDMENAIAATYTRPISVKTSNYILTESDYTVITATNSITFTLPNAASYTGRVFKTINMSSGSITINCATGSQIKHSNASFTSPASSITGSYYNAEWQSDGTYWYLISQ